MLALPYLLLAVMSARAVAEDAAGRVTTIVITVVTAALVAIPPFLGGVRELEIAAARSMLGADLPEPGHGGAPAAETRLRAALWFGVHLGSGALIGAALLIGVPLALIAVRERFGIWWWLPIGAVVLAVTPYAVVGLGALARTLAPALLGPSPAERSAALDARERALAERNRLATELHDSVGHALTAVTLQAGAARAVFDTDPGFARRALGLIEEAGRTAMEDLDHVLGLLRDADEGRRRPDRTLADLERLSADVRAGGVDLRVSAEPVGAVPAAVSREGYRIVQEALTNAAKHGGAGPVRLRLTAGDEVVIDVRNPLSPAPVAGGGGRGLVGMRERVRLLGGSLAAGPQDGEWRVRATLPAGAP